MDTHKKTQVVIVGGGVAGLMLSQLLHVEGISCVILERQTRAYTEGRIRAGVLEFGTVNLMRKIGVSERMDRLGLLHEGFALMDDGEKVRIALHDLVETDVMVYGQTEITIDLMDACVARGTPIVFEVKDVVLHDFESSAPYVTYIKDGSQHRLDCDFIAGCDGAHGVCRATLPDAAKYAVEKVYPFGWLGILSDVPPMDHELIYSNHERGFALASQRSSTRSRYYIQCDVTEKIENWSDDRIWDELEVRLGDTTDHRITRGPSLEKSIAPLKSFVCEKMQHGRLFIAGDAAHIVPPTGAKGLNLAASDVSYLADALIAHYKLGEEAGLKGYTDRALSRIWKAERFSWSMTQLTHRFPQMTAFDRKMQKAELSYIRNSAAAQTSIAENYIGLPY
ncbi:4-hydroxybenzoate 3-monooxygenase [Asticcacaulis benevestitus]|uniref:4-hydroxybenzoate 3-monooxygenase n=1 Tax=Asticcacaulis benevestitus DSM 16100 = ATCC BAA-896 TaxID=1121022 RepID=V4RI70_9CAUL|nr:4-hydroxybenzoate 3-monooxygenase [Asticcacaulis benevestitus]ESQ91028.1 4-hydroxybenzoate 3-monooxygenase [Asticcacaulis benevestitus DSM 16100 = ATCC BAA-896]